MEDELKDNWEKWCKNPEFTHLDLGVWGKTGHNDGGFKILWGIEGIGFGELVFVKKGDKVECDNETMSEKFCSIVLEQFLKKTFFRNEVPDHKLTVEEK